MKNNILCGDALTELKKIPSESVDCIITSPPYWALRDYKVEGQIGVEKTIDEYIDKLVQVFDLCKTVLKKEGTCWIVLGDTYAGTGHKGDYKDPKYENGRNGQTIALNNKIEGIKEKSLCMVPERFAIKMINNGWILRNKIIWKKNNCMPSSAKDRFTIDYEHVYFFTKSQKYYFKTQYEPYSPVTIKEFTQPYNGKGIKDYLENGVQNPSDVKRRILKSMKPWSVNNKPGSPYEKNNPRVAAMNKYNRGILFGGRNKAKGYGNPVYSGNEWVPNGHLGRIKRCVWTINTAPFKGAHFAVFPEELVKQCLDAGCPENGIIFDPFMGAGTTALVALKNNRSFLGIELSQEYIDIALKRIKPYLYQTKLVVDE